METPQPINFDSNKLKHILAVMKKTDKLVPKALSENVDDGFIDDEYNNTPHAPIQPTREQIMNSGFSDDVKKVMLERPIPKMGMNGPSYNPNEPLYNDEDEKPMDFKPTSTKRRINETVQSAPKVTIPTQRVQNDLITISKAELNSLINERLIEAMTTAHDKKLVEDTIKRTITTLMKEGKLVSSKK